MGNNARCREAQDLSGLSRAATNGRTKEVESWWLSVEGLRPPLHREAAVNARGYSFSSFLIR